MYITMVTMDYNTMYPLGGNCVLSYMDTLYSCTYHSNHGNCCIIVIMTSYDHKDDCVTILCQIVLHMCLCNLSFYFRTLL